MKRGRAPASGGSCQSGQLTLTAFGNGGSVDIRAAGGRHSLSAFTRPADAFWGGQPIHGLAVVPGLRWAFAPCSPPLQPYDLRDATLATLVHLDRRWQGKRGPIIARRESTERTDKDRSGCTDSDPSRGL